MTMHPTVISFSLVMPQLSIRPQTNIGSVCVFLIIVLNRAVCLVSVLG